MLQHDRLPLVITAIARWSSVPSELSTLFSLKMESEMPGIVKCITADATNLGSSAELVAASEQSIRIEVFGPDSRGVAITDGNGILLRTVAPGSSFDLPGPLQRIGAFNENGGTSHVVKVTIL